ICACDCADELALHGEGQAGVDTVRVVIVTVPSLFLFFNLAPPTEIYTLSLHDALPICRSTVHRRGDAALLRPHACARGNSHRARDRKSTRLNSSHLGISYAVFCLKKKRDRTPAASPPAAPSAHRRRSRVRVRWA